MDGKTSLLLAFTVDVGTATPPSPRDSSSDELPSHNFLSVRSPPEGWKMQNSHQYIQNVSRLYSVNSNVHNVNRKHYPDSANK